jgi:DNA-binding CsgD family transcriptional regulator
MAAALDVLRRTVHSGQGQVLTLVGEPGIGKTTLLHAVAEQARRMGYGVGIGKAQVGRIAAGAPLLVALRSGAAPLLDADAFAELGTLYRDRPIWLVDRIAAMLEERALAAPLLVAVDDGQWADELTLFALDLLPSRLAGSPVVWLTASRPVAAGHDGGPTLLDRGEAAPGAPAEHRIALGPLRAGALEELAADRLGAPPSEWTALLLRTVGGNPFWAVRLVEAVARDGDAQLPADLLLGVRGRLPDDNPDLIELLRTCAVWGPALPVADAATLLDVPVTRALAAVEQGAAEGLLERAGTLVSFRHDLIREAVYADLTSTELTRRHRECGRHLQRAGASALEVASHFTVGADLGDREAVRVLRDAAAEAAHTMPGAAAQLARQAFDLVAPGTAEQLEVGEECATLLVRVRHTAAAVEAIDWLLAESLQPDDRARLEVLACLALWNMDRLGDIGRRAGQALALADLSPAARIGLEAARTLSLIQTGTTRDAAIAAQAALDAARVAGDATAQRMALLTLTAVAKQEGRHQLAHQRTRVLRELVGDEHLADEIRCLQLLDRYDEAAQLLAEAHRNAPTGIDARTPDLIHAQMWQEINLGRLDDADAEALTLLRVAAELGRHSGTVDAYLVRAFIALVRGEPEQARRALQPAGHDEQPYLHNTARHLMTGWIALLEGDAATAAALYAPLVATAETSREYWPWFPLWARPLAQAGVAARNQPLVTGALRLAAMGAERNPGVGSFAGLDLQIRGFVDGDPDTLGEAVTLLRAGPRPLLLASALADLGHVLLATGATEDALTPLTQARQIYRSASAALPTAAIDRALADAGLRTTPARRPPRPGSGWAALTDTERRVAELVGAGNTNREAATTLRISPNTVNTHLRAVFAKLDVRSRVQLANTLHDQHPSTEVDRPTPRLVGP